MSTRSNDTHKKGQTAGGSPYRLPCRGCTERCRDYPTCAGKPWATDTVARTKR